MSTDLFGKKAVLKRRRLNVVHNIAVILGSYLGGLLQTWTGTFFWTYILVLCGAGAGLAITRVLPTYKGSGIKA